MGKLVSLRLLGGMALGVFMVMGFLLWDTGRQLDIAKGYIDDVSEVVRAVGPEDAKKPEPGKLADAVMNIATDRDIAKTELRSSMKALHVQSDAVRAYEAETKRLRALSAQQVAKAAVLIKERQRWIAAAQSASTRTQQLACDAELKQTEDALDALYQADF